MSVPQIWQHCKQDSRWQERNPLNLNVGVTNITWTGAAGVSQVKVPGGYTVSLHSGPNGTGSKKILQGPTYIPCLLSIGWNDKVKSVRVTRSQPIEPRAYSDTPWAHQHCGAWGNKPNGWSLNFKEGQHDLPQSDMSSINLPKGWDLELFSEKGGRGNSRYFEGPVYVPCFWDVGYDGQPLSNKQNGVGNMNDTIKSYKLDRYYGGASPPFSPPSAPPPVIAEDGTAVPPPPPPPKTWKDTIPGETFGWSNTYIAIAVVILLILLSGSSSALMMFM